jgi:long-chain acyl-CoA synthetase
MWKIPLCLALGTVFCFTSKIFHEELSSQYKKDNERGGAFMETKPWHRHYDYNVPTTIRYPRISAYEMLQLASGSLPDKAALDFFGTQMTFWELKLQALRMANALGSLGVSRGERVGLHLPNCPQFVIAYFAVLSLGGVVVNMNPLYTPDELKFIIENTGMDTLITFDMVLPNIRKVAKEVNC